MYNVNVNLVIKGSNIIKAGLYFGIGWFISKKVTNCLRNKKGDKNA